MKSRCVLTCSCGASYVVDMDISTEASGMYNLLHDLKLQCVCGEFSTLKLFEKNSQMPGANLLEDHVRKFLGYAGRELTVDRLHELVRESVVQTVMEA